MVVCVESGLKFSLDAFRVNYCAVGHVGIVRVSEADDYVSGALEDVTFKYCDRESWVLEVLSYATPRE